MGEEKKQKVDRETSFVSYLTGQATAREPVTSWSFASRQWWEVIAYNPAFNYGEFATIRNPTLKENQRDYATINQLICISNMENINAVMINDGAPQPQCLKKLNEIAIQQMRILAEVEGRKYRK